MKNVLVVTLAAASMLLSAGALAAQTCDQYGVIDLGEFKIQNNIWNPESGSTSQCVSDRGSDGFTVDSENHNRAPGGLPSAYPSIWKGCHWTNCTQDSGMPIKANDIGSASFSWSFSRTNSGTWNAAPEIWFKRNSTLGQPDGLELMWWFDYNGTVFPGGSKIDDVTLDGTSWEVWFTNDPGWNFMTFKRKNRIQSGTVNMKPFMQYAVDKGYLDLNWYLMDVEAGFELWNGGEGLRSNSFDVNLSQGSFSSGGNDSSHNNDGYSRLKVRQGGKCLDIAGISNSNGANLQQYTCGTGDNQQFRFESVGGDWFKIRAKHSGKCLNVNRQSRSDGANIHQWNCSNRGRNLHFKRVDVGDGWFQIIGRQSDKCLDGAGQSNGANIQQWGCWSGQNQQFRYD